MSDAFVQFMQEHGLPAWAVLLIGGGAIAAAVITALNALVLTVINVRSARRLALDVAHRQHRETVAQPFLERTRFWATLAVEAHYYRPESYEMAERQANAWFTEIEQWWTAHGRGAHLSPTWSIAKVVAFHGDRCHSFLNVINAMRDSSPDTYVEACDRVSRAALRVMNSAHAVELAIEGYVFDLRRRRLFARWLIRIDRVMEAFRNRWPPPPVDQLRHNSSD